jgi:uncharacterized Tic20 family protein
MASRFRVFFSYRERSQEIDIEGKYTMADLESLNPTQDERVMAALAQISVLVPFLGVVAPIVIWVTQKDKSRYVAFQSLQAVAFQLTMVFAWFLGGAVICARSSVCFLRSPWHLPPSLPNP